MNRIVNRLKKGKRNWLYFILGFGLVFGLFGFRVADDYFQISRNLQIFADIYREANIKYVDNIKPGDFMKKGVDAMLSSLDPYTEFIPESDMEDFKMKYVNSDYGGIGALIFQKSDKIYISDVYEGFPAQKQDIRAGDQIVKLNGINVTPKNSKEIGDLLKGQKGTNINLVLRREGFQGTMEKKMSREEIHFKNVSYYGLISSNVGYIKLDRFLENSASEVREALVDLKDHQHIQSLILDLRGNGGGILQESVKIVNLFVNKSEKIVTQKGKGQTSEIVYKAMDLPIDHEIPLVVLMDKGSASASEIVAGALQDLDRAIIVGQRSYGKGLVQQTIPLSYNTLMKITVAKYYTPSGRCIQTLDYGHRNSDGSVNKISDSSIRSFKTKLGREVFDGSGIYPDVLVKPKTFSTILYNLISKQLIFDYATEYRNMHPAINSPQLFKLNEADFSNFETYLANKNFDYTTNEEKLMTELQELAEKDKSFDKIQKDYLTLKSKISHNKEEDLIRYKPEIKRLTEIEIVGRYYYQKGRLLASLSDDPSIKESMMVLSNHNTYASIINGNGKYHSIGDPNISQDSSEERLGSLKKPYNSSVPDHAMIPQK